MTPLHVFISMQTHLSIPVRARFDFAATAYSHGWVALAPHAWDAEKLVLTRVETLGSGNVVSLSITGAGGPSTSTIHVEIESRGRLGKSQRDDISNRVGHMFRVDEDLGAFYRECRKRGGRWRRLTKGLGRLLRSPTLFEDIVKVICTTNIQWGGTKKMVEGLVQAFGQPMPGSPERRAFPEAESIASVSENKFASKVRMGYRAPYVHELAEQVASGELDLDALSDSELDSSELKRRLLAIKGVGNYAAATLLMLLGHYDELPVDTVCRDFVTQKYFNGKRPTEAQIRQIYDDWGQWKFLAYWFDVWLATKEKV